MILTIQLCRNCTWSVSTRNPSNISQQLLQQTRKTDVRMIKEQPWPTESEIPDNPDWGIHRTLAVVISWAPALGNAMLITFATNNEALVVWSCKVQPTHMIFQNRTAISAGIVWWNISKGLQWFNEHFIERTKLFILWIGATMWKYTTDTHDDVTDHVVECWARINQFILSTSSRCSHRSH